MSKTVELENKRFVFVIDALVCTYNALHFIDQFIRFKEFLYTYGIGLYLKALGFQTFVYVSL